MIGPGTLVLEPNPVGEGKDICVAYSGTGTLQYSVDGGAWKTVELDPETGQGKVKAPVGSVLISFSDHELPNPTEGFVDVVSNKP